MQAETQTVNLFYRIRGGSGYPPPPPPPLRIHNLLGEIFKFCKNMNTLRNFAKSVFINIFAKLYSEFPDRARALTLFGPGLLPT